MSFIDNAPDEGNERETEPMAGPETTPLEETQAKLDIALRAYAELKNERMRMEAQTQRQQKAVLKEFAGELLSVSDNLDRALTEAQASLKKGEKELEETSLLVLIQGLELVQKTLMQIFEKFGVKKVPGVGEIFDPHHHQSIGEETHPEMKPGYVLKVLQEGYVLHDVLLRPSLVLLSK